MFGQRLLRQLASALLVLSSVIFVGCEGGAGNDEIVIGHYGSMTGPEATFGQSTDNGVRMAVEKFNAAGGLNGRKVRLITYDDKGDSKEVGTAVSRLVSQDKVVTVLGEVASSLSLAGAPICQEAGVPMISPSSTNPRVTKVGDKIFRVCFIDPFQGFVCAKFVRENPDIKAEKVAILYDQTAAYSTGLAQEFEKAFTSMGGTVPTQQAYNAGDQDFTAQLTTIRSTNPDAIFIPGYYTDVANIALQARKLDIKVPLVGGDGWDSSKLAEIAGDAIEGCYYSNHYSHQDPSPRVQDFITEYKAKFGRTPDGLAALGYDSAMLLFDAMQRAKSLGGDDLTAAIASTKDFPGVTGSITIDAERNAVKPSVMLRMTGGTSNYVTTIEPPK